MRKFTSKLALSTALGLVFATAAMADNNTVYLEQNGTGNVADVDQSRGSNNNIASAVDPVTQNGNENLFLFNNNLSGGADNVDITKAGQVGNNNVMRVNAWNNGDNNVIGDMQQIGNQNQARVDFNGGKSGGVDVALQQGDNNHLEVWQNGTGNVVNEITMLGSNNGLPPDGNGSYRRVGVLIDQGGTNNLVEVSYIEGSNNTGPAGGSNTYRNVHRIDQSGTGNGQLASVARTWGSEGNRIWVFQTGNTNNFDIEQGTNSASTQNFVTVDQTGNDNAVWVRQFGSYNTAALSFVGDRNGNGAFSSGFDDNGLTQGQVIQDNDGVMTNSITYSVLGSDNLFAFKQDGTNNLINGTVGDLSASDGNQVAVLQVGNNNVADFSQVGGSNSLSVSQ